MRQAILLEPDDLTALRTGTPLTIQVGDARLYLLMAQSASRDGQAKPPNGGRSASRVGPATPVRRRRKWTPAKRREIVQAYLKLKHGTGERVDFLRRRKVSPGHFHHMRKAVEGEKP